MACPPPVGFVTGRTTCRRLAINKAVPFDDREIQSTHVVTGGAVRPAHHARKKVKNQNMSI
jgi:hypothetical protein